ncbi:MAG TPA: hypothetical protein QGF86_08870 [Nitrospinaceae bacterium]|nr:hypothetical protein [Nitrospinaceae bacterium]HJO00963.1 hypothetical protein [Nitrospinaceae bacterium]
MNVLTRYLFSKRSRTTNIVAKGEVVVLKMDGEMISRPNLRLVNKVKDTVIDLLAQRLDDEPTIYSKMR